MMTGNKKHSKIIFALVTEAFNGRGGIAQYNRDIFNVFNESHGIKTYIFPRRTSKAKYITSCLYQFSSVFNKYLYVLKTFIYALNLRPQVIYCGHLHMITLAYMISLLTRSKLVCQLHGIEVTETLSGLNKYCLLKCKTILCVSEDTRNRAKFLLGQSNVDLEVIHNTVSEKFEIIDRALARSKFGQSNERFLILTVARLDASQQHKGQDTIIKCLQSLIKVNPYVHYLIAGEGDDEKRLRKLASDLNVENAVTFMGYVPSKDLVYLYNACDLFAMPSTGEGFGIAFVEAMACGVTTIGLSVAGARDPLALSGYHCITERQFNAKLIEIVKKGWSKKDPALREKIIRNFGREALKSKVLSVFNNLL
ncbi:glycosyltransferase family 4 protein [Amylibacter sp.]|nr:glycosyltransferase family 4 protein [Amylibacter sp.]